MENQQLTDGAEKPQMFADLVGCRFGRLVVEERWVNSRGGHARWICRCDCGKRVARFGTFLRSGRTQSCGCANRDRERDRRDRELAAIIDARLAVW